ILLMMEEICLIIKAPNQKYDDLKINCQLSWTIHDLKTFLYKEYPSKPNIADQRLIYSGHLLKDEQYVRDIIQSTDEDIASTSTNSSSYTFHLVCSQRLMSGNHSDSESISKATTLNMNQSQQPVLANVNQDQSPVTTTNESIIQPTFANMNSFGTLNNLAVHESYNAMMCHYYQYMSYMYLNSENGFPDNSTYNAFMNAYMNGMANNNNEISGNVPNVLPQPVNGADGNNGNNQQNQNNNNNQDDQGDVQRDWTETLYSFSKAMVMFSIMYFYSSFGRLLLLVTIAIILYLLVWVFVSSLFTSLIPDPAPIN
ncbi:Homocysteine-responsive endoplasmic reticulum-resident ubiquitin-like domain member 2, partial [Blomia tropicalis]